jgi:tRNA (Thr-GGU) A37 N-methylase
MSDNAGDDAVLPHKEDSKQQHVIGVLVFHRGRGEDCGIFGTRPNARVNPALVLLVSTNHNQPECL